jgi:tetratricopeptide (TPR) repeat protein
VAEGETGRKGIAEAPAAPTLAPVTGWLTDLFRLFWALLYWNARKTVFRLRRRRGASPCQSLSDSGKAYETQCEACASWNRAGRFRRVCPLLVETPDGLRCSVNAEDVRPFWGRALGCFGGTAAALYLLATLAVFLLLRTIGYELDYVAVAWPPAWHRIDESRARYFAQKGFAAFAANNIREAVFALGIACELDPQNYRAGITLARLWEISQPRLSDGLYARLLKTHPAQAATIASLRLHALLARGDFERLRDAARQQIAADPANAGPSLHALIFATRRLRDDAPLQQLLDEPAGAPWRPVLQAELLWRSGRTQEAAAVLAQPWSPPHPYFAYYQMRQLLALGRPQEALALLQAYGALVPGDEAAATLLAVNAQLGLQAELLRDAANWLGASPTPAVVELLATHLVRYPNAELLRLVFTRLDAAPLPANEAGYRAYCALFCAAGVGGDRQQLHALTVTLKERAGATFVTLNAAEDFFLGQSASSRIESFLPVLTLPVETLYALLERYAAGRPSAPSERSQ